MVSMPKRKRPFNNPFAAQRPKRPTRKEPPALTQAVASVEEDEAEMFRQAVGEVAPVPGVAKAPCSSSTVTSVPWVDSESEAYAELCALVDEEGPLDLSDTDEY